MTLRQFIRENRDDLDSYIAAGHSINDEERRLWILNDEGLYRWARQKGVRI